MTRPRFTRLWPYVVLLGFLSVAVAIFIVLQRQTAAELWAWAIGFIEANWYRAFGPGGRIVMFTAALMVVEVLFLSWEKTTVFNVFVRRGVSPVTDFGFMILYLSHVRWVIEYGLTFGIAYAAVPLSDSVAANLGWFRLELPTGSIPGLIVSFIIFYFVAGFVAYWHHRVLHWRWFWQLHRFHHSATELNIFTGARANPTEALLNVPLAISPLIFLKAPDASLFASFILLNQIIASLQHSQLPWSFGWFGRWIIISPLAHQIHHSTSDVHREHNFGICPLWDQVFGTWYKGTDRPTAYGIQDPSHTERPLTQWLIDVWIFYRDIAYALAGATRAALARLRWRRPSQQADASSSLLVE